MCVANTSQDSDTIRYFNLERSGLYHGKSGLLLFTPLTVNDVKLRTLTAGVSLVSIQFQFLNISTFLLPLKQILKFLLGSTFTEQHTTRDDGPVLTVQLLIITGRLGTRSSAANNHICIFKLKARTVFRFWLFFFSSWNVQYQV